MTRPRARTRLGRTASCLAAWAVLAGGARAATGGPDAAGYTWADSLEPGVGLAWEEETAATRDVTVTGDDVNLGFQPLSFAFPYYGASWSQVAICANGWISLADAASDAYENVPLPAPAEPFGTIAAWWDDQYVTAGVSRVLFTDLGTRAVVTFEDVHDYRDLTRLNTYQVVLHADGRIRVVIREIGAASDSATIGIESPAGDVGLTALHATAHPPLPYAVEFSPPSTVPSGLDCTSARPVACGDRIVGDLAAGRSGQHVYGCDPVPLDGREDVHRLDLAVPTSVTLELVSGPPEARIVVLSSCDASRCLAPPSRRLDLAAPAGSFVVVVDVPAGAEAPYELAVACVDCPPGAAVSCGSAASGDLALGSAGRAAYGCGGGYEGRELAYRLDVAAATDLRVRLTALSGDPDLLVLDGCDPNDCTLVADGEAVLTGVSGTRWLVVDSAAGAEGAFRLDVGCLGDDFAFCDGAATFEGDRWGLGTGAWFVDGWFYPTDDTSSFALRVDGGATWAHGGTDCPDLLATRVREALQPGGPASVAWTAPGATLRMDVFEAREQGCCGLAVRLEVTNEDAVPHWYEARAYLDLAFGAGGATCMTTTVDGGPVEVGGVRHVVETDLLAAGAGGCPGQIVAFSAEDPAAPRASFELLPPNLPVVAEFLRWDDGLDPCTAWSGLVGTDRIDGCRQDSSLLFAWRFPHGAGTLAPGESASASFRIGRGCTWPCGVACESPVLGAGAVIDLQPCNRGLLVEWDPATFPGDGRGTYHVYRSTVSHADALARPPLSRPGTLRVPGLVDADPPSGVPLFYVVQAESLQFAGCGAGPLLGGSTATLDLPPVVDVVDAGGPDADVGGALRLARRGESDVALAWPGAPALGAGEAHVVLRSDDRPAGPFAAVARTPSAAWVDPAAPPRWRPVHVWYYDVRIVDACGVLSGD